MERYLLGIDLGTSACKAAVFDREGNVIAASSQEYPVHYPGPGWAEQDPDDWWRGVCAALRKIWDSGKVQPNQIAGIGVDGQSWSAVPVDVDGKCLCPTPIWMDFRAQEICDRLNEKIGADRILDLAGNAMLPSYTTPKVLWYKENRPEVYERTERILQCNGYLVYRLTGSVTQDICQGYGWHCFNMRNGTWDFDMAREMGIPEYMLPEIYACDAVVGGVTPEAAGQTGLTQGTPVVAGGLDAACGTLAAGVLHEGETQEQGGQAGGMSICLEEYKTDPRLIMSFHVIPDRWLLQGGTVGGGSVMRWFEEEFGDYERSRAAEAGRSSLDQLNDLARQIAPGCDGLTFLPYLSGERTPIWDPDAKGVFYGLSFAKTKGHMVRACMEGVAYALRHNLETAKQAGAEAKVLRAVGGSSNSLLWTQIKADVTGCPVIVPSSDTATTLGAALLAGVGCGIYRDYEEAVALTVKQTRFHEPDPSVKAVYDKGYEAYRGLYEALKDFMKKY